MIIGLTLLGALSPLLTFAKLFQLKEWRWDRLREHLRQEGVLRPLFGIARPFLAVVTIPGLLTPLWEPILLISLSLFVLLTLVQFGLRKQPMPVWTKKALMIVVLSLILDIALLFAIFSLTLTPIFIPLLIVGQPFVIGIAWALLLPLDYFLKQRIMNRARTLRSQFPDATVIGIAGSVGKTTTKELLNCLLQDLKPLTTPAHVNTEMGVANWLCNTLQKINPKSQAPNPKNESSNPAWDLGFGISPLIVEMGAYRTGEISLLSRITQPTIGILTTLGADHLALFGSEEAIRKANTELIDALPEDGHAFIAYTDKHSDHIAQNAPCPAIVIGHGEWKADDVREDAEGLHFSVQSHELFLPLHGMHNVTNALLAIAVARTLGIEWSRIKELLHGFQAQSHTFHVHVERGVTVLDDTYNISVQSFAAALEWAKHQNQRPRILVTNGLLEVGEEEDRFHAELGEKANGAVDHAIFLNAKALEAFEKGYKGTVELLTKDTHTVPEGSVLLCIGRMPLSTITRLLPPSSNQ